MRFDMRKSFAFFIVLSAIAISTALECKVCDSAKNKDCAVSPDKIQAIKCTDDKEDKCIVEIDSKNTIRKCGKVDYCKESGKDSATCKECAAAEDCGKVFPENRPKCIQCSGTDCAEDSKAPASSICVNYDKDEKCYVAVKDDGNAYRGCMSDTDTKGCTENEKYCRKCESSETDCNKKSKETYDCIKCSGDECKRPKEVGSPCTLGITSTEPCQVLYGRDSCFTLQKENEVTRGCFKPSNQPITGALKTCLGAKCNSECIKDLQCPQCKISENANCADKGFEKKPCPDYTSACHWCEDKDGHGVRGCGKGDKDHRCNYGYSDEDPAKKPQISCYVCGANDANCATLEKQLTAEECPTEDDECVVAIQDSKTIRGCFKKIFTDPSKCKEEEYCKRCQSNNCNGDVYPVDRRKCYQCSKSQDCKIVTDDKVKSVPCPLFSPNDKCYTHEDNSEITRGCWSDTTKNCKDGDKKCATCNISNCNKEPPTKDATLKCAKCDKDKPECAWAQGSESEVKCSTSVAYWQEETCFTYQHNATVISRGCTLDSATCDGDEKCQKCTGDNCNNKNKVPFSCYRCRNDDAGSEKCGDTADGIQPTECKNNEKMSYNERGCYTRRDGDKVIRGCLVDLTAELRTKCLEKDSKECHNCLEANCNNKKPPNSSTMNRLSVAVLCFAMLVACFK